MITYVLLGLVVLFLAVLMSIPLFLRKVVETNKVHIVQSSKKTISYGTGCAAGNAYYAWPSWVPVLGITRVVLPVNNFELHLKSYEAYDKGRVPFQLDVVSFFRIKDTNKAAERISDFNDLKEQLKAVLQGAIRKILSSNDIHQIMTDRATFGNQFTAEVSNELENWGVEPVKNIELMDIRDHGESRVITNIMAIKTSHIEMESRTEVAKNLQTAKTAEIESNRLISLSQQHAEEEVGKRTLAKEQALNLAKQKMDQDVAAEEVLTTEKQMAVRREAVVKQAEIDREAALVLSKRHREVAIISAEAERDVQIMNAEAQQKVTVVNATAKLEATKKDSEGISARGTAEAEAEKAKLMAPVQAQITLAQEIGQNENYQKYLVDLKKVEAQKEIGVAQATALKDAQVKIIANAGNVSEGVTNVMDLFSSKGGLAVGAALEALSNTPQGEKVIKAVTGLAISNGNGKA